MGWVVAALLFDLGLEDVYLIAVQKDGDNTLLYATTIKLLQFAVLSITRRLVPPRQGSQYYTTCTIIRGTFAHNAQ